MQVDENEIDELLATADVVKDALIEKLLLFQDTPAPSPLHTELRALKPSQLKKRAKAAGVAEVALEDADDAESPKEALIALVLEAEKAPEVSPRSAAGDWERPPPLWRPPKPDYGARFDAGTLPVGIALSTAHFL